MKFIIIFVITLTIVVSFFFLVIFSPYFIYFKSISKGFSSPLFSIAPKSPAMILRGEFRDKKIRDFLPENEKTWKIFHFTNFEIPLPVENPIVQLYPRIESENQKETFGGFLNNYKGENFFSFIPGKEINFVYPYEKQKFFSLPIIKNFVDKIPPEKMFEMVFSKDLDIKNLDNSKKIQLLRKLWAVPYMELALNLFILQLRNDLFPKEIVSFSWDVKRKMGVVELTEEDPRYYREIIFLLVKNKIVTFNWKLQKQGLLSDNIRHRYLKNLKYKESYPEANIESYNEYRTLTYEKKISSMGFTILYCGLSHNPDDLNYLKSMVRDLKKMKEKEKYLDPIYSFGQRKFKIDLSVDQDALDRIRIEKEKAERLEAELREASKVKFRSTSSDGEDDLSKEEKVEIFLKDAKEKGEDIEEGEGIMLEN